MIKEKEKIKTQIIKALDAYKGTKGIDFFDSSSTVNTTEIYTLDVNELEVLLLRLDKSNNILLTTKCLIIDKNNTSYRIDGNEIESYNFVNVINNMTEESASELKNLRNIKSWLCSGDFRIVKKNKTIIEVYLPNSDFGFCLYDAIKKLQFVTNKYDAI